MGPAVYLASLKLLAKAGHLDLVISTLVVVAALFSTLPMLLMRFFNDKYMTYREYIIATHYFSQHVIAPYILVSLGVSYREHISNDPVLLIIGLLAAQTVLWQVICPLVCPMRLKTFLFVQPVLIFLATPLELKSCNWAWERHPETTTAAFIPVSRWLRTIANTLLPLTAVQKIAAPAQDPLHECYHAHTFFFVALAYIMTGTILWIHENQLYHCFLSPANDHIEMMVAPSTREASGNSQISMINTAMDDLWCEEVATLRPDPRTEALHCAAHVCLALGLLWQGIDIFISPSY